jgi:hypothetical protein
LEEQSTRSEFVLAYLKLEPAMKTEPLFDRPEIDRIIQSAKAHRVEFLLREEKGTRALGVWARLGAVTTACLAFFSNRWHSGLGSVSGPEF